LVQDFAGIYRLKVLFEIPVAGVDERAVDISKANAVGPGQDHRPALATEECTAQWFDHLALKKDLTSQAMEGRLRKGAAELNLAP
jgi:hypothetical protein